MTPAPAPGLATASAQLALFGQAPRGRRLTVADAARRPAPYQAESATSAAAGKAFERGPRSQLQKLIVRVLLQAGPEGLTIEQIADRVSESRGRTKETSICGRVAGRQAELGRWVLKTGRTRRNASGHRADVWVHVAYRGGQTRGATA